MLKSILFGPGSLSSKKPPSHITQGKVCGTTHVTPGAIVLMAILMSPYFDICDHFDNINIKAIFLHSRNQEFAPVGAKSKIPYEKWFQHFKQFIMKNATLPEMKSLFMWWNRWVFTFTNV